MIGEGLGEHFVHGFSSFRFRKYIETSQIQWLSSLQRYD